MVGGLVFMDRIKLRKKEFAIRMICISLFI